MSDVSRSIATIRSDSSVRCAENTDDITRPTLVRCVAVYFVEALAVNQAQAEPFYWPPPPSVIKNYSMLLGLLDGTIQHNASDWKS